MNNNKNLSEEEMKDVCITFVVPSDIAKEMKLLDGQLVKIEYKENKITISNDNIFSQLPNELLKLYDELGISRETVEAVLSKEYLILKEMNYKNDDKTGSIINESFKVNIN